MATTVASPFCPSWGNSLPRSFSIVCGHPWSNPFQKPNAVLGEEDLHDVCSLTTHGEVQGTAARTPYYLCRPYEGLSILKSCGSFIRSLHNGMRATVQVGTDEFEVTCGLRHGCILAPSLFVLFATPRHHEPTRADDGISIRYRTDGEFFNIRRLRTKKATISIINELLYADDAAFGRHTTAELQRLRASTSHVRNGD